MPRFRCRARTTSLPQGDYLVDKPDLITRGKGLGDFHVRSGPPRVPRRSQGFRACGIQLWPNGPVCPKCGSVDRHYSLKGVRTKPSKKNPHGVERHGLYKCSACRSQFTVRMGSIFEESHLPLTKWLQAIHLMCALKKRISAHQMHRIIECTYEAAWFLCHRIRLAMASGELAPMGGNGKTVEVDETYIGRLPASRLSRAAPLTTTLSLRLSSAVAAPVPSMSIPPALAPSCLPSAPVYIPMPKPADKPQIEKFREAALELKTDQSETAFEKAIDRTCAQVDQ